MGALPAVAFKGGKRQRLGREQRATEAAPIGRHDGPASKARISKVHPSPPPPAVLGRDLKDVAIRRAFLDPLVQASQPLAFALACRLGLQPLAAGFQRADKARREPPFLFVEVFRDGVLRRAVTAKEQPVGIRHSGNLVVRRAVRLRHLQGPLGHPQRVSRDKVVGLHAPQGRGADLTGSGERGPL